MTAEEYYESTPFWFHIKCESVKATVERENIVNLYLLNVVINMFSDKNNEVNYDDIFGIEQLKDLNLKSRLDFDSREDFNEYLESVVYPIKRDWGLM